MRTPTPISTAATVPKDGTIGDLPPLVLWRTVVTLPEKSIAQVRAMLGVVAVPGQPRWIDAVVGDLRAAVGLAIWATSMAAPAPLLVDLAATTVFLCAPEGHRMTAGILRFLRARLGLPPRLSQGSEA